MKEEKITLITYILISEILAKFTGINSIYKRELRNSVHRVHLSTAIEEKVSFIIFILSS